MAPRCRYVDDRTECRREATEPDGFCIVHSPSPAKDSSAFSSVIDDQMRRNESSFRGYVFPTRAEFGGVVWPDYCDMTGAVFLKGANFIDGKFPEGADFTRIVSHARFQFSNVTARSVSFIEAQFREEANFSYDQYLRDSAFSKAQFQGSPTWFSNVKTDAYLSFAEARFEGTTYFDGLEAPEVWLFKAELAGRANFRSLKITKAVFSGASFLEADFSDSRFAADVDFAETTFSGEADFRGVQFSGTAVFSKSSFGSRLRMNRSLFTKRADFFEMKVTGECSFWDVSFAAGARFDGAEFADADFSGAEFGAHALFADTAFLGATRFFSADLQHATFRDCSLARCYFSGARNLDKAEFSQVEWPLSRTRRIVADEVTPRESGSPWMQTTYLNVARIYRGLRASYVSRLDHQMASDFYFGEMEMLRIARSKNALLQRLGSLTAWYGLISGYGERWLFALGWFILTVVSAAILYLHVGLLIKTPGLNDRGDLVTRLVSAWPHVVTQDSIARALADALLHSFLVATFIGRDFFGLPADRAGVVVQTVEAVLGPLFLALMALGVRRRFQR
jgi:uncharacterized protein YjbI with pentapeptide repeats